MPVDDEAPSAYRRRLFNRLARKLSPDHRLASIRSDDLGGQEVVFENFEQMLLEAAKAEGERPSIANLPPDGAMISRARVDADSGAKVTEFFGTQSFVKDFTRAGRRVARIIDPNSRTVIWGQPLDRVHVHPSPKGSRHMVREVKSPWTRERPGPSPARRVGTSPWSSSRADNGHLNQHAGKGWTPVSRRERASGRRQSHAVLRSRSALSFYSRRSSRMDGRHPESELRRAGDRDPGAGGGLTSTVEVVEAPSLSVIPPRSLATCTRHPVESQRQQTPPGRDHRERGGG